MNELHYVVAYRDDGGAPWRRGGDHGDFPSANVEAKLRGLERGLAIVCACWRTDESMDMMVTRLNTPRRSIAIMTPGKIDQTMFTAWWRRLDESLRLLDEDASTMGEAQMFFASDCQPALAAIKLRRRRIQFRHGTIAG